jgi:hypothetical protein
VAKPGDARKQTSAKGTRRWKPLKGLAELGDFKLGRHDVIEKISGHWVSFSRSQKISPSVNWLFLRCGGH